ncbi:FAD-dependent oxidoreductase [Desulfobulbus oligotrophicus]|uniref:FAD-dependent oxidoreductase n=1 Tax=Desulfobulbus oligotrophicus TaxID=1909699 RepID=A0A7T6APH2_9BACT|nr:FAD-dependent oxidoreductase [Desulfobulbus oligotrophicus]QQG64537.1 FAD-dependent oxidoreductase [Desulfobulbus oligotrophicus]
MKPTDIENPEYFHRVIDCQYACPAHTAVPEYIRLISEKRYTDAYMLNWVSNVFPGVLGRVCDRPCEPACRRGRVEKEPVAICRLKRLCADNRDLQVSRRFPRIPDRKNGKKVALIGAGPASLTVARDLMPLGYTVDLYDDQEKGGGFMRSQLPSFRLPETVLATEVNYILDMGVTTRFNHRVESMQAMLGKGYDAVFVGTGAPRGRDLPDLPGREEGDARIHIGIDWLAGVIFGHINTIGQRVLVLGGGNTAMDCCRTARRLGGEDVRVVVRSPRQEMKASPWEIEEALEEDVPIIDNHVPLAFVIEDGKLTGMRFDRVRAVYNDQGQRRLLSTGEEPVFLPCDEVILAVGQLNAFPWIESDAGIVFNEKGLPVLDPLTLQSSLPQVFFGGDAAFGPRNIITAVAHGHEAAISIDLFCQNRPLDQRPAPQVNLAGQQMGTHDWLYDNRVTDTARQAVPMVAKAKTLKDRLVEVELGFDTEVGHDEALRCLNCDIQTVFHAELCIECDACADACPVSCINFVDNGTEEDLRTRLKAPAANRSQALYVSAPLDTGRVMVKDENVCLHCSICAERCPTAAWEMQKFFYQSARAGQP